MQRMWRSFVCTHQASHFGTHNRTVCSFCSTYTCSLVMLHQLIIVWPHWCYIIHHITCTCSIALLIQCVHVILNIDNIILYVCFFLTRSLHLLSQEGFEGERVHFVIEMHSVAFSPHSFSFIPVRIFSIV